jgi:putative spermidine/putrescine transport system substrate-binding protein
MRVSMLRGAVPSPLLNEFRNAVERAEVTNLNLTVIPESTLQKLFGLLQTWKREGKTPQQASWREQLGWIPFVGHPDREVTPDWAMLGDYWLGLAIQQELIQPIDIAQFESAKSVLAQPTFKRLLTRNQTGFPDETGKVWAMPHQFGSTVIAYRKDLFAERNLAPPQDWSDLWRTDLRRKITVLDQPRQVIGLTLKKLGKSYNTVDLNAIATLKDELRSLHQQIKLYSSDNYLEPLLLDDAWVAVGWSSDILPLLEHQDKVATVVPRSGTALWAEVWVRPAGSPAPLSKPSVKWIDFYAESRIAEQLSEANHAIAPAVLTIPADQRAKALRNNQTLLPDPAILQTSEFLAPLPKETIQQYQTLWEEMRKV